MPKLEDLKILPKVAQMAEQIDSPAAYQRSEEIFATATYEEAHAIIEEAAALLRILLKRHEETGVGRTNNLQVIAENGKKVGQLASALEVVATLVVPYSA